MISLKPRKMLLPIRKNRLSTPRSLTRAMSGRLALGPQELGTGGAEALPNASPCWNTVSIYSITGNTLLNLKSKSSLATFSPEAGSGEGHSHQEPVLSCGLKNYLNPEPTLLLSSPYQKLILVKKIPEKTLSEILPGLGQPHKDLTVVSGSEEGTNHMKGDPRQGHGTLSPFQPIPPSSPLSTVTFGPLGKDSLLLPHPSVVECVQEEKFSLCSIVRCWPEESLQDGNPFHQRKLGLPGCCYLKSDQQC